ncbi:MAG: RHS repeat-associated core domain-containing protein, partial [Pseudonocardia sp.]|nr:RHS repeat-associated core domain-containing protein [Pseudonocardia sp.]
IPLRYRWTGREWDAELGLYFHRARYYDPKVGRFIQEDPIGYAGGGNLYTYVGGSPIEATDPSGLSPHPSRRMAGPFPCSFKCSGQTVLVDGVPVEGGDWLLGMPGLYFAGYSSGFSVSGDGALVDRVWAQQAGDYTDYLNNYDRLKSQYGDHDNPNLRKLFEGSRPLSTQEYNQTLGDLGGLSLLNHWVAAYVNHVFVLGASSVAYFTAKDNTFALYPIS